MHEEIPYFIKIRGCINCSVSKEMKKRNGHDYGFDHELMVCCAINGCHEYNISINNPFFDPEEVMKKAREIGTEEALFNGRNYCLGHIKPWLGKYFQEIGISLDEIAK